jgi:hypothetical protein
MWRRLKALIIKELLAVFRDPRSRMVLIGPPLLQIFVFSYAATLDISNIDIAVLNRDSGRWSAEVLQRLGGAPAFRSITPLSRIEDIRDAIDNRKAVAVLHFAPDFSRDVTSGNLGSIQVVLDGRRSNASQIVLGYLTAIANDVSASIAVQRAVAGASAPETRAPLAVRHWFNPNLAYIWFTVPGLIGTMCLLISLVVTGQSVARERELGTFDQLMVSPLRTSEILAGKLVPPLIIGMAQATAFILVTVFFFQVPLRGSLILLYLLGGGHRPVHLLPRPDAAAGFSRHLHVRLAGHPALRLRHAHREHAGLAPDRHADQSAAACSRHPARRVPARNAQRRCHGEYRAAGAHCRRDADGRGMAVPADRSIKRTASVFRARDDGGAPMTLRNAAENALGLR